MNRTSIHLFPSPISLLCLLCLTAGAADGSLTNNVSPGKFGGALNANWSAAVATRDLPAYRTAPLTVELWCRLHSSDGYNILVSDEPKDSAAHWEIYTDEKTGTLSAYLPGVTPANPKSSKKIADSQWHYVAMVLDGRNITLFADGQEVLKTAVARNPGGAVIGGPLRVGQAALSTGAVLGCDGEIDEVRVSSCVREIKGIPTAPFTADAQTVGLWDFNLTAGAREFADASMNHNPLKVLADVSLSELDRVSYKAGPSPMDSAAQAISLRNGAIELPAEFPSFSLDGTWQLLEGGTADERLAGSWTNAMAAPVPGSVHTALYLAGVIPFPYLGRNQDIVRPWSYKTYYYQKRFPRPPKGQDETLVFKGICNRCTIWLNGRRLGEHEGMFDEVKFSVREILQPENTVMVKLDPAIDWQRTVVFNNSYGWHYSKFPPLGIWQSVCLHGEPDVKMQSPFVATRNASQGIVDLMTTVVGAESGWSGKLAGMIVPENFPGAPLHFEQALASPTRGKEVHFRFTVPDPELWWPVDMGKPNLYRLRLAFAPKGGGRPDVQDMLFGIRTVEMAPINGRPKPTLNNWTFVINGQPMFMKGADWCTDDAMMDFSRARYDRFLSMSAAQHLQIFRAWGSGLVETDDFYDLCDRKGLMVLQEWPTAWDSHFTQPYDMLERTVRQGICRLRNHPSLALYAGGNESGKLFGPAIDMMGRLAIELDGTRDFHRGDGSGSAHDHDIWWLNLPLDHVFEMKAAIYTETGIASCPNYESVQRYLPDDEKNAWPAPANGAFVFHTPIFGTAKEMDRLGRMSRYFTSGQTMEQFILGTQLAQTFGIRHPLEYARSRWPAATGFLYYKINDNCPAASWATVDWYGAPKLSYYFIQRSFAPLLAVATFSKVTTYGEPLSLPIHLLDDADALRKSSWKVVAQAYGTDLKLITQKEFGGRGPIQKVAHLGTLELTAEQTKTAPLLVVTDVIKDGAPDQRNYYFTNLERQKDGLFNLPQTVLAMKITRGKVTVSNKGALPAVAVEVSRPGHLDTLTLSENYFWLQAGEEKTITATETEGLCVKAWNAPVSKP